MYLYDLKTGAAEEQDHRRRRPDHRHRPARSRHAHDVVQRRRQGEGTGSVLHAPLQGRPRRQGLRLADARQRHAHRPQISPDGKYVDRHVLAAGRRAGDDAARRHHGRADHAAREGRHLEAARHRLEAADADQDDGGRRQERDLRHALPADELRSEQEVSDHQPGVSRAAVGQRRLTRVHRGARRPAGPRRARLRRRQHRRHRARRTDRRRSPTRTTARWAATTRSPIRSPA